VSARAPKPLVINQRADQSLRFPKGRRVCTFEQIAETRAAIEPLEITPAAPGIDF